MRAGADYHLDDKNTISLGGFGMMGSGTESSVINNKLTNLPENDLLRNYKRDNSGDGIRQAMNVTLDYKHDFDTKGSIYLQYSLFTA